MYKEMTADTIQEVLQVDNDYTVDTLITYGGHPKQSTEKILEYEVQILYPDAILEDAFLGFFQDVKSYKIGPKRVWFCVTYGGAITSEIVHIACLLGANTILHGGSCGALHKSLSIGDIFLPISSDADESCTRMYVRDGASIHNSDPDLRKTLANNINLNTAEGKMISIQAMLAETREDVDLWSESGYFCVDLEVATVFAVAKHFDVSSAAILYISDNLVTKDLVHTLTEEQRALRKKSKHSVIRTLLQTA